MSTNVDSRVVDMQFNNSQFEANARTSISTLDKLKSSLNMSGAAKGFDEIDSAARKVDVSMLGSAVESVKMQFSALEVMAVTALVNITNSAVNTGKQLIKSLSIDQISSGYNRYVTKTSSVQTIMNSTGLSIEEVNGYLDKLMWFSDETSYGFTDMTAALAQMTSTGGDVEKLIPLITGVANATAYAGKGANEFSRAMYNLNQSYGAGSLQYMDWKSLELAGVASKELKQVFIDTAVAMGKIKEGDVTIGNFNQTLSKKWADTEVMERAFGKFSQVSEEAHRLVEEGKFDTASEAIEFLSGKYDELALKAFRSAQEAKSFNEAIDATKDAVSSGWMKTFELIFGNYTQAKKLWTDLANALWDTFASGAEKRNEILAEWSKLGGRDILIESFWKAWENVGKILSPIKEALNDIFPAPTAERLVELTTGLKNFMDKLSLSGEASENLKRTFKGLFAVIDILKDGFLFLVRTAAKVVELFGGPMSGGILAATGSLGDFLVKIRDAIKATDLFGKVSNLIIAILTPVANVVKMVSKSIKEFFGSVDPTKTEKVATSLSKVRAAFDPLENGINAVVKGLSKLKEHLRPVEEGVSKVRAVFDPMADAVSKATNALEPLTNTASKTKSAIQNLAQAVDKIKEAITPAEGSIENIKVALDSLFGAIVTGVGFVFSKLGALFAFASKVGGFIAQVIGNAIKQVKSWLSQFTLEDGVSIFNAGLFATLMIGINKFVGSLKFKIDDLKGILSDFKDTLGQVRESLKEFTIGVRVNAIATIAGAIAVLAASLFILALIPGERLAASLGAITVLFVELSATMYILSTTLKNVKILKMTGKLTALAVSILILATAMKMLSELSWGDLIKGALAIGALMAMLTASMVVMSKYIKKVPKVSKQLIGLGVALLILVVAVKVLAGIELGNLAAGVGALGVLLAEIALFSKYVKNSNLAGVGAALIGVATGMVILSLAVKILGSIPFAQLAQGLLATGAALLGIALIMKMMPEGMAAKAAGILVLGIALQLLMIPIAVLGRMSLGTVATGLIAMAGGLTVLMIALKYMQGTIAGSAALLVAALAIAVLAPALFLLGSMSISTLVKGLVALAGSLAILAGAAVLLTASGVIVSLIAVAGALALLGVAAVGIGAGIFLLSTAITTFAAMSGPALSMAMAGITSVVMGLANLIPFVAAKVGQAIIIIAAVIIQGAPLIGKAIGAIVLAIMVALVDSADALAEGLLALIDICLEVLVQSTEMLVQAGIDILMALLEGIRDSIGDVVDTAGEIIIEFLNGLSRQLPGVIDAGFNVIIAFINGIKDAIDNRGGELISAVEGLFVEAIMTVVEYLAEKVSDMVTAGENLWNGFVEGMGSLLKKVVDKAKEIGQSVINAVTGLFRQKSPSRVFMDIGENVDRGLIIGMDSYADKVYKSAKAMGSQAIKGVNAAIKNSSDILDGGIDLNPRITPILDLSNVVNESRRLDAIFSRERAFNVAAGINNNARLALAGGPDSRSASEVNINVYPQELTPAQSDYLIRRANEVLGGKI